jgi:cytochrome c oxidase assembly factor CtaG
MPLDWNWNPLLGAALLLPAWAYAHGVMHLWRGGHGGRGVTHAQVAAFVAGMVGLAVALISPMDTLGHQLLSVHMLQHLLLMLIVPPLLVIGAPPSIFLWVLPLRWRRRVGAWGAHGSLLGRVWRIVSAPFAAWLLHAAAIWLWHVPGLYEAALTDPFVHWLEHVSFFGTAWLFWHAALRVENRLPGILLLFTTALHTSILGALMTFSNTVWYPIYVPLAAAWGVDVLEDQRMAGLIMWMPGGILYLIAILWLFAGVLRQADDDTQLSAPN